MKQLKEAKKDKLHELAIKDILSKFTISSHFDLERRFSQIPSLLKPLVWLDNKLTLVQSKFNELNGKMIDESNLRKTDWINFGKKLFINMSNQTDGLTRTSLRSSPELKWIMLKSIIVEMMSYTENYHKKVEYKTPAKTAFSMFVKSLKSDKMLRKNISDV